MSKNGFSGFSDEERRMRVRMAERGLRIKDIAARIGIDSQDVTKVFRGTSRSPRYIAEVYNCLGLDQPVEENAAV